MATTEAGANAMRMAHISQILLCLYGLRFSYSAITKLQKYEETSKKLATYSKDAETHLRLTRSTQATGLATLLLSLLTSLFLSTYSHLLTRWIQFAISPALLLITMFARGHIKSYWNPYNNPSQEQSQDQTQAEKASGAVAEVVKRARKELPNMKEYGEAEEMTERELEVLQYLEWSWLVTSFFMGVGLG